jgi:HK97 family phage major capsid protein
MARPADGSTLDADQSAKYDSHAARVKSLDLHLARLREMDALNLQQATPVTPPIARPFVQIKPTVPKGTAFVRLACAKLVCKGNTYEAAEYAKRWDDSTPEVALALKAAVAPGTVTDATWAAPLVNQNISSEFIELLRAATVIDKIPGLRQVPFNTKVPTQTAGGTYGWVGESKPKPVTKLAFSSQSLGITKVAGIVVLTQELIRLSNPKAEELVRRDMVAGIAAFLDSQFLDPAVAAVAGVNPASITNGAATAAATTNPMADIMGLINHFVTNGISPAGVTFVLSPSNALSLSFRTNLDGSPEFPGVGISGGSYRGLTFITSTVAGTNVVALQPDLILYADDGGVTIDASTEASLQMDSAPTSPADATTVYVSLWQTNTVGLRAERFANWLRVGTNAVKYLTATAWPAPTGGVMTTNARGAKE